MKRILVSILTIGVVTVLMGAGTFSYFSDVESASFTITGGVIDLEVDEENPWCESISIELKPQWDWERDFKLHMTKESNPAKAWFRLKDVMDSGGPNMAPYTHASSEPEYEAEGGTYRECIPNNDNIPVDNISDFIKVDISFDSDVPGYRMWYLHTECCSYAWIAKPLTWDWRDHLDELPSIGYLNDTGWIPLTKDCDLPHNLTPCKNYTFHLSFHNLLNGDDNEYQGDETTFKLEFYVTQTDNNQPPSA